MECFKIKVYLQGNVSWHPLLKKYQGEKMNKDKSKLTNDTRYLVGSAVVAALYAV